MLERRFWIPFFFLCFLAVLYYWSPISAGFISYKLIENKISFLDKNSRNLAEKEFYARGKNSNIFAGTVIKIFKQGKGGVWVKSNDGLRYFQSDEFTIYSYYDVCQAYRNNPQQMRVNDEVRVTTDDIKKWSELVSVGDFIQVVVATEKHGGTVGNLREALVYSYPLFLRFQPGLICTN